MDYTARFADGAAALVRKFGLDESFNIIEDLKDSWANWPEGQGFGSSDENWMFRSHINDDEWVAEMVEEGRWANVKLFLRNKMGA